MAAWFGPARRPLTENAKLEIGGGTVPVVLRRNRQARRIIVRLDREGTGVVITVPLRASRQRALEFARSQSDWISSRLLALPVKVPFQNGSVIPLRGVLHQIQHSGNLRGGVNVKPATERQPARIEVAGDVAHLARRMSDWLKAEAKKDVVAASEAYARKIGVKIARISVRDQSSRWGSCSALGHLSYSWRLIFAPVYVLNYVAAHEVAHLVHMNHGPKFWALVRCHCDNHEAARRWMRGHGRELHSYGAPSAQRQF